MWVSIMRRSDMTLASWKNITAQCEFLSDPATAATMRLKNLVTDIKCIDVYSIHI